LFRFETPHKGVVAPPPNIPPATSRSRPSPIANTTKLRPKSLFVTPTVLNDATALSKLQQHRSPMLDSFTFSPCSSSTICDAESLLTTSTSSSSSSSSTLLCQQQGKRLTLYNSLPTLNLPLVTETTATIGTQATLSHHHACFDGNANESAAELDQISDLTSKMFSSEDDEDDDDDGGIGVSGTSTCSSSTIPSDVERSMTM
jgi:hypothetical protein